ncbi:MAG: RNA polymerase sigma-70 factor [Bacteroidota bacterium]
MTSVMNDNQLYVAIQEGDEEAFSKLFEGYYENLCNFGLRYSIPSTVAEELVSDIFLQLWNNRRTADIKNLRSFLYASTRNKSINWLRSNVRGMALKSEGNLRQVHAQTSHEHKMIFEEELSAVQKIIAKMPEQRRIIFLLNRIDGLKYREIGEVLGISPFTVQNQMVMAVRFLHEHCPDKKYLR